MRLDAVRTGINRSEVRWSREVTLPGGSHSVAGGRRPTSGRLVRHAAHRRGRWRPARLRGRRPATPDRANAPVVRVLGVEAAFTQRSYLPKDRHGAPGARGHPVVHADSSCASADGPDPSQRNDEMTGAHVDPITIDWTGKRSTRRRSSCSRETGRAAYTRRARHGTGASDSPRSSFARRSPTRDASRWFCRRTPGRRTTSRRGRRRLGRHLVRRRAPRSSTGRSATGRAAALPPLRPPVPPLAREDRREPDVYADDDLERSRAATSSEGVRPRRLPRPQRVHDAHGYDLVERFRDLGGNLMFLSANNFFWKVEKRGQYARARRAVAPARSPEARLLGVQYRANDDGTLKAVLHPRRLRRALKEIGGRVRRPHRLAVPLLLARAPVARELRCEGVGRPRGRTVELLARHRGCQGRGAGQRAGAAEGRRADDRTREAPRLDRRTLQGVRSVLDHPPGDGTAKKTASGRSTTRTPCEARSSTWRR